MGESALPEGFSIRELTPETMQKHLDEWSPKIFADEGLMLGLSRWRLAPCG